MRMHAHMHTQHTHVLLVLPSFTNMIHRHPPAGQHAYLHPLVTDTVSSPSINVVGWYSDRTLDEEGYVHEDPETELGARITAVCEADRTV